MRDTTDLVLVHDEDDCELADEEDCMLADEDVEPTAVELASFATLEDEVTDVDLRAGAPLVLVLLEDTCLDVVAVDELSCEAEVDELFEEELMTFDDELLTAGDET